MVVGAIRVENGATGKLVWDENLWKVGDGWKGGEMEMGHDMTRTNVSSHVD